MIGPTMPATASEAITERRFRLGAVPIPTSGWLFIFCSFSHAPYWSALRPIVAKAAKPTLLRRTPLLRGWVNKGLSSLLCRLTPEPGGPSRNGYGPPDGYKLAYSVPCANPYHHLPKEAPRLHTPVHVALHVTPKWGVLPPFQVRVRYNQD